VAGWTWYTGSASWLQKVIVDHLIGVRADKGGLIIDPNFPDEWEKVYVKRFFRGKFYHIEFENPQKIYSSIDKIFVNDKEFSGYVIPEQNHNYNSIKVKLK
jgi:cellobiose phosphorylase